MRRHRDDVVLTPSQDAYISEWYPKTNFGDSPVLFVSNYQKRNDVYRSLIQFDLFDRRRRPIPPRCRIEKATLELKVFRNEVCGRIDLKLFRVLENWRENRVTWDNQPDIARRPAAVERIREGFFGTVKFDITDLVRGWHSGRIANNGVMIKGDEERNNLVAFHSREARNSDLWPRLIIELDCRDRDCGDRFIFTERANIFNADCRDDHSDRDRDCDCAWDCDCDFDHDRDHDHDHDRDSCSDLEE
ncbi:MAG: DNRLRE domain-containing protein [Syntrophomonadaceae bacterium]